MVRPRRGKGGVASYADFDSPGHSEDLHEDDGSFDTLKAHRSGANAELVDAPDSSTRRSRRAHRPSRRYIDNDDDFPFEADDGVVSGGKGVNDSDESDHQVQIKRRSSRRRSSENGAPSIVAEQGDSRENHRTAVLGASHEELPQEAEDERYARELQEQENRLGRTATRLRLKVRRKEDTTTPPRKQGSVDYRDAGLAMMPISESGDEGDDENLQPARRSTRSQRSPQKRGTSGPGATYEHAEDDGGSEYEAEEEVEEEEDPLDVELPEDELLAPNEEEEDDDDFIVSSARKVNTRSRSRPASRTRSAGSRKSRPRRSNRRGSRRHSPEEIEYVGRKRARKQTERFGDELMQSELERRRSSRSGGTGRGKSGGGDLRKPQPRQLSRDDDDDDDDLADSPDTSDSSDFDDEIAAAANGDDGNISLAPMADAPRARPSRYVRKRSRTSGLFSEGGVPGPHARKGAPAPAGIEPIQVDLNLSWDDIGGLDHHVRALKEMVFLPLLYPEVFEKFKMEPPKGVLFYGPPGTGKTLCARALAASCGAMPAETRPEDNPLATGVTENETKAVPGAGHLSGGPSNVDISPKVIPNDSSTAPPTSCEKTEMDVSLGPTSPVHGANHDVDAKSGVPTPPISDGDANDARMIDVKETKTVGVDAAAGAGSAGNGVVNGLSGSTSPVKRDVAMATSIPVVPEHSAILPETKSALVKPKPRVAFFMRNGADCLSKWVGEAERQLRMTFEAAKKHAPSIIFFDEIDGLAPVRSARQDQIHSSIVSTLLGLMDGLDGRGQIVVIGATNRVDSVDPALRRPGRFDRELIFTLPNGVARRKILDIHTSHWKPSPPQPEVLDAVASKTVGYCGADLRALCSESALRALRRRYPQIYKSSEKLLIDVDQVQVRTRDFISAMKEIVPASHRSARTHARPIPTRLVPLLEPWLEQCVEVLKRIFPQGLTPELKSSTSLGKADDRADTVSKSVGSEQTPDDDFNDDDDDASCWSSDDSTDPPEKTLDVDISRAGKERVVHGRGGMDRPVFRPRVLLCGAPGLGQEQLGPALLHFLEGCPVHAIDLPSLFADGGSRSAEESLVTAVREACRAVPSILYLPHLAAWWETAGEALRTTLNIALRDIPAELPLLVLGTAEKPGAELSPELPGLFGELVSVEYPSEDMRRSLLTPILAEAMARPKVTEAVVKRRRAKRRAEVLPKAPPPPPKVQSPEELARNERDDDMIIRELRMEMREFVERIRGDRRFVEFRDAVDPSVVKDYYDLIKDPMWIGKIAEQVDKGMYPTVLAMVKDFDTLVQNVIDYNPPTQEHGAYLLRRAHCLIDVVHSWVDKLNPELVERCNSIVAARLARVRAMASKSAADAAVAATLPRTSMAGSAPVVPPSGTSAASVPVDQAPAGVASASERVVCDSKRDLNGDGREPNGPSVEVRRNNAVSPRSDGKNDGDTGARMDASENDPEPIATENENGPVHEEEKKSVQKRMDACDSTVVDGLQASDEPEEPFVPVDPRTVDDLKAAWLDVTREVNVDALDILMTRCSSVLYDTRRSSNRNATAGALLEVLQKARSDPSIHAIP